MIIAVSRSFLVSNFFLIDSKPFVHTYQEALRRVSSKDRRCKPCQDPAGTRCKIPTNHPEIRAGRVPGASEIKPGPFRNAPKRRIHKKVEKRVLYKQESLAPGPVLAPFWKPASTPKFTNTGPGPKKCVRKRSR